MGAALLPLTSAMVAAPAAAATPEPQVVFVDNVSTVSYDLAVPPDEQASDTDSDAGIATDVLLANAISDTNGEADARSRQRTTAFHGPADVVGGYDLRELRSNAHIEGTADNVTGLESITSEASSRSATRFKVNAPLSYAFNGARSVQTDNVAEDCTSASVVLRRADDVVWRRTLVTGAGCDAAPANVNPSDGGDLTAGTYTLVVRVDGNTHVADGFVGESVFAGTANAVLTLGPGKVCDNLLPGNDGGAIVGTSGRDVLCGGAGPDEIDGRGGNDLILGQGGGDVLRGGPGEDVLHGHSGGDDIRPGADADKAYAGSGNDTVSGCDNTKDVLRGEGGTDTVFRDNGDDVGGFEESSTC